MCDYDNPYGMSDQEFQYRAMNPQEPMYMGDSYKPPYSVEGSYGSKKKGSKKSNRNQHPQQDQQLDMENARVCKDMPEWLFLTLCFLILGLLIFGGLWLLTVL